MIVGAIQDPGKINNLQLLFYKTEAYRLGSRGETATYEIRVDVKPEIANN
jgi:hypothetical protein